MSFQVIWTERSKDDLASLWLSAPDRPAVAESSERINRILKSEGWSAGESRVGTVRVLIDDPLACYFRHHRTQQIIVVVTIWRCRGRSKD